MAEMRLDPNAILKRTPETATQSASFILGNQMSKSEVWDTDILQSINLEKIVKVYDYSDYVWSEIRACTLLRARAHAPGKGDFYPLHLGSFLDQL